MQALFVEYQLVNFEECILETALFRFWRDVVPAGVLLGERLFHSGELRKKRDRWSAPQAFDWLLGQVAGATLSN